MSHRHGGETQLPGQFWESCNNFALCSQDLFELLDSEGDGEVYQKDAVAYLRAQNKGATKNMQVVRK